MRVYFMIRRIKKIKPADINQIKGLTGLYIDNTKNGNKNSPADCSKSKEINIISSKRYNC